jgi:hypothetical protein
MAAIASVSFTAEKRQRSSFSKPAEPTAWMPTAVCFASEAYRLRLAHLFDPYLAVSQPLRFLLADDLGAGKTVMAGLLIKELLIRGDLERCLSWRLEASSSSGRRALSR